jgi:hypothetical protein
MNPNHMHAVNPDQVPLKYNIEIGTEKSDIPIPLFADYVLAAEGPHKISDATLGSLLLIHPQVAPVLTPVASTPASSTSTPNNPTTPLGKTYKCRELGATCPSGL